MRWFSRLSVRGRTLVVGCVLSGALIAVAGAVPVPYVALAAGPTHDTLGEVGGVAVIAITGDGVPDAVSENVPGAGHLNMTTVSPIDHMTMFAALGLWATGDYPLVPREDVYPPDKTIEEVHATNAQLFSDSQSDAEIAALRYLGYPNVSYVGTIPEGSPSLGVLNPQDRIVAIDGEEVGDVASLRQVLGGTTPGQVVTVTVLRDDEELDLDVTLVAAVGSDGKELGYGALGIFPAERPAAPFDIEISLANIGGPSAGLMFTLGIIDKLTPGDLTGGRFVAGTGEIKFDENNPDASPRVGAIGGVLLKMIGARNVGATVFLVPEPNCQEAITRIPDGLMLVKVATLDDAVDALHTLADGGTPPTC